MMRKIMMVGFALVFTFGFMFMMTSCAKRQITTGEAAKPVGPPVETKEGAAIEQKQAPSESEAARQARLQALQREQRLRSEIQVFESEKIYFDFDKSDLKPAARKILNKKAAWLLANPGYKVQIAGNCDERGTAEYNMALGERRAESAWKYLNALGVSGNRMTTISYGEERPADPAHNEKAWALNRRDEFKLMK